MKKKICFITNDYYNFDVFYKNHILNLSKDFEILLLGKNIYKSKIKSKNISKYEIPISRKINILNDIYVFIKICFLLKTKKISMVQTLMPKAGFIGMLSSFLCNIPIRVHIFTGQVWFTKSGFLRFFLITCDKIISKVSTHILCDGISQRKFLIKNKIINSNKIQNIGNGSICGVDQGIYFINRLAREKLRSRYNLKINSFNFLYLGRVNIDKGILEMINFFSKLLKINKNIFLMIVGRDEMNFQNYLRKLPKEIQSKIKYFGYQKNSNNFYNTCDCNILLSKREGFGNSVIESAFVKKFSIISNTYGLKDFVNNKNGVRLNVVSNKNVFKINKLIKDKKKVHKLSNNAFIDARKKYNSNLVSKNYYNFYKCLLSKI